MSIPAGGSAAADWAPDLTQVADHVPYLTVDKTTPGDDTYLGTFTANTSPTDTQAQRLIDQAVVTVTAAVTASSGSITETLYDHAAVVASLRAAAAIQRAYPRSPDDLRNADTLDARADAELARLLAVIDIDSDAGDYGLDVVDFDPHAAYR